MESYLDKILSGPLTSPPASLYRFSCEKGIRALNGTIKVTPPTEFNDPFEMWAGIAESGIQEVDVINSVLAEKGLFRLTIRIMNPDLLKDEASYVEKVTRAVKENPQHYRSHLKTIIEAIRFSASVNLGAACFAAFSQQDFLGELGIRHWAMYGASHKGMAIEYDGNAEPFISLSTARICFPVEYLENRELVPLHEFNEWSDEKMWKTMRRWFSLKCKRAWGDEKEWRFIYPISKSESVKALTHELTPQGHDVFLFQIWNETSSREAKILGGKAIRSVFVGNRASREFTQNVLKALDNEYLAHVKAYRIDTCETNYALKLDRLK